ncbi:unnamed protein product [Penicillium salamii]|uniref:Uncharacterized protein n=1 Tax=Penicillium salamii TaxID=1612424 RepID=A0A9W4NG74_9EURO|nr:unnamed protein product [Penicillium salamii]CAG8048010.1 unnamed protein product [Penicillium salamii]CAG8066226.1 unnamed protein product [Penicillium salamii]CAG8119739.1 unnamed protein product [Penicillium salamii]CAG8127006.1 unnamed protein product [Penicillium salamii]
MAKKGGKKNNKKGNKPAAVAAAAVEKVKDVVTPDDNNVEDQSKTEQPAVEKTEPETAPEAAPETATETATESAENAKADTKPETPAPVATESPAVSELKESVKDEPVPAIEKKESVDETVEKAQASKAGQLGELEGGDAAGTGRTRVSQLGQSELISSTAVIPEKTTKEPATGESLPERPKTSESIAPVAPVVAPVAAPEPIPAPAIESDAAHAKRPYEKPIFNNEENLKPTKMPKTEEEKLVASAAEDKKTIENLAGAGPASTAAYTTPEPVPVKTEAEKPAEAPKVEAPKAEEKEVEAPKVEAPKAEEKKAEKVEAPKAEEAPKAAEKKPEEKIPVETKGTAQSDKASNANPDAVAAANAAITSSKNDKAAPAAAEELQKPEAALKRGEQPLPKTETPAETEPEAKAENKAQTSEATEEKEKKKKEKGGFLSWLKRKFK